ncbi:speckle-type POZ protein-like [Leptopilina heterotoma]|uniref:speckle-type POZ protein-like n=1 Tax=Leptopilina heterotoma TaxID=63436 RepID=UPI001CA929C9|nr:speckle-type POZ protein-like [Leptopilina heterotoma]
MAEVKTNNNLIFNSADDEKICTSKLKFNNFELTWNIENFDFICANIKIIESPKFPSKNNNKGQWFLQLEPTELNEINNENFNVLLKNVDDNEYYMNVSVKFFTSTKLVKSLVIDPTTPNKTYFLTKKCPLIWSITASQFFTDFQKLIPKDITINCQISVFDSGITVIEKPIVDPFPKYDDLIGDMDGFYRDKHHTDVIFVIGRRKFPAHKAILSLRSSTFAALFKNKIWKSETGKEELNCFVRVVDTAPSVFENILNFIYTDRVENLQETSMVLYIAAKKYQLNKLQSMCIGSLKKNLSQETIFDTLKFANQESILNLKKECFKRLNNDLMPMKDTEEFFKFGQEFPYLVEEINKMANAVNVENNHMDEGTQMLNLTFRDRK